MMYPLFMVVTTVLLDFAQGAYLERNEEAPSLFSVWEPGEESELLGSGDTSEKAITEARKTVDGWNQ